MNFAQMKLQYEILNKSVEQLATENEVPTEMLRKEITKLGWTQWWPEADLILCPEVEQDAKLQTQSEAFIERSKRRLAVYNLAKEMHMAQKYMELENQIIDTAVETLIRTPTMDATSIASLSNLYKNMTAKSIASALSSISFGEDEGGLPTVIIKDLSGRRG